MVAIDSNSLAVDSLATVRAATSVVVLPHALFADRPQDCLAEWWRKVAPGSCRPLFGLLLDFFCPCALSELAIAVSVPIHH
jgi:hypothetical protein